MQQWIPALALSLATAQVEQTAPAAPELSAVRFYRDGATLVDGFLRVPFAMLDALTGGPEGTAHYRVAVTVRDSGGLVLHRSSWAQSVPVEILDVPGTSSVEHFTFGAAPGRYSVEVSVTDSASGRVERRQSEVVAFDSRPAASDLLLAPAMRRGAAGDTASAPGEIRKGALFVTAATRPVLTPRQAVLFYYVELYSEEGITAHITAMVLGASGGAIVTADPAEVTVPAGGGVASSGINLTGLPPGEYRLALDVAAQDTTVRREAEFVMADFETERALARTVATREADMFADLTEQQLDSLYAPLVHIQDANERGVYENLSVEGRRNYLRRFWDRRDPTPGTPVNEVRREYYERIEEANRRFREGGAAETPGWRTDRGRVFIRYGAPDDVLNRPVPEGEHPFVVWKYTRGRGRKFVFLDETGLGHYALVYTNARQEPSRQNWELLVNPADLRAILNF